MTQPQDDKTRRLFRDALGRFTTGVAVVSSAPAGFEPLGLTVNSFSSVSLEPPLVLWCVDKQSDTLPAFTVATHFAVNILKSHHEHLSVKLSRIGNHGLEGLNFTNGKHGSPVLEDAFAWFDCKVHARDEAGDHIIIIGHVLDFGMSAGGVPLVYHAGDYQELAP
ncbi:MAG: flavin reductase family protein [Parvularculales bacterium]